MRGVRQPPKPDGERKPPPAPPPPPRPGGLPEAPLRRAQIEREHATTQLLRRLDQLVVVLIAAIDRHSERDDEPEGGVH